MASCCGAHLAVDATLVSRFRVKAGRILQPIHSLGLLWPEQRSANAGRLTPSCSVPAAADCRLVVFGIEAGDRWSEEAATFLRLLARARAASAPAALRSVVQAARVHRWSGILSVSAQRAFAASLLELPAAAELGAAGDPPALHELLTDARWLQAPANSRLPARLA